MPARLLALAFLAGCTQPTSSERDPVGFADLGERLRVEASWSALYSQATIHLEYGPGARRLDDGDCVELDDVRVDLDGGGSVMGLESGGVHEVNGCEAPRIIVDRVEDGFQLALTDVDGAQIAMAWDSLHFGRAWQFDTPILQAGETVRMEGLLPGDTLSVPDGETIEVTLTWIVGLDQEWVFLDGTVVGNAVELVVPAGLPSGLEVRGLVEGPVYAEALACAGVAHCKGAVDYVGVARAEAE